MKIPMSLLLALLLGTSPLPANASFMIDIREAVLETGTPRVVFTPSILNCTEVTLPLTSPCLRSSFTSAAERVGFNISLPDSAPLYREAEAFLIEDGIASDRVTLSIVDRGAGFEQ